MLISAMDVSNLLDKISFMCEQLASHMLKYLNCISGGRIPISKDKI